MKSYKDFSVAAVAWTPKERRFTKNPGKFEDWENSPCWRKPDLADPIDDLIELVGVHEAAIDEAHAAGHVLFCVKCRKGEEKAAEKGIE